MSIDYATAPHVVLAATPIWSHFRALCILAARLAAERPIVVTVVVPNLAKTFSQVQAETGRFLRDVPSPRGRLQLVALGEHCTKPPEGAAILNHGVEQLPPLWEALSTGKPLTCAATQTVYAAVSPPSVIILDKFLLAWHDTVRALSPNTPLLWYCSATAAGVAYLCFPGGRYAEDTPLDTGDFEYTGRVVKLAGLPPMHDWEFVPQGTSVVPDGKAKFKPVIARSLYASDGIVTACSVGADGEAALDALTEWAAQRGQPAFHVGPLLPLTDGKLSPAALEDEVASAPPGVADAIKAFLDSKEPQSVVYVCFGTNFWPSNTDHLWALLDALNERDIPFILSHAAPGTVIPEDAKKRYEEGGKGLLVSWSPQQTTLAHKAIGWFVSHGGAGSTLDALLQGVPLIGWPGYGDQPASVAHLTHVADVAFELIEVRTGALGLKPLLPSGKTPTGTLEAFRAELKVLFDDMAGPVGQRKRENARKKQAELQRAWAEGGPARKAFDGLVAHYKI